MTKLLSDEVFINSPISSPAHTIAHLLSVSKLNLHRIEQVADISLQETLDFKAPNTNLGPSLGAAGSRTDSQIKKARSHTLEVLASIPDGQPIAFTDGSALGNPGPCGAASILYTAGMKSEPVELTKSIAKSGTSYLGELWGIALTLEFVNDIIHTPERLDIFVDCTSAIASCTEVRPHVSHQSLIQSIQNISNQLSNRNCSITYHKVAAHVNIEPNERADKCAKTAAKSAADLPASETVTWQDCRQQVKSFVTQVWQRQWNRLGQQRLLHRCYPTVKYSRHRSGLTRRASSAKIRLLSGQNCLAEHLHRIKFKASPNCPCGSDRQDTNHIILHCPSLLDQRNSLVNDIDYLYHKHNVPPYKRSMSLIDILAPQHDMKTNTEIDHAFSKFIQNCPFKI
jgi:ribonuclease HI